MSESINTDFFWGLKGPSVSLFNKRLSWATILLFTFSLLLFVNTLSHQFVMDDAIVITENDFTQNGFSGWKDILTNDTFRGFFKSDGKDQLVAGGRYRPLSMLIFAAMVALFGNSPFIFHLFTIVLFAICSLSLFYFLRHFLSKIIPDRANIIAGFSTLFFAAHPIHTEVVANVKGCDEILALLFGIFCLKSVLNYLDKTSFKSGFRIMSFLFLSLLAKENALTFIAIVPLLILSYNGKLIKNDYKVIMFSLFPIGIYLLIRTAIIGWPKMDYSALDYMNNPFLKWQNGQYVVLEFSQKFGTIFAVLLIYLKQLFVPISLLHDYYPKQIALHSLTSVASIASILLHVGLIVFAAIKWKKNKIFTFSIFFYLFTLFITSNIILPVGTILSERFLFFPSVAFCLLLAYFIFGKKQTNKLPIILSTCILLAYSFRTVTRNYAWKDNFTLFQTDVINGDRSAKLLNAAGGSLITKYGSSTDEKLKNNKMTEAIGHLNKAVNIHPLYKNAYLLLGNAHLYKNQFKASIENYNKALTIDPNYKDALANLFLAYRHAGRYYGEKKGDINQAIRYLEEANKLQGNDFETNRLLGVAYGHSNQHEKAIKFFKKTTEIKPKDAKVWFMLGMAYSKSNELDLSVQAQKRAISLDPNIEKQFRK